MKMDRRFQLAFSELRELDRQNVPSFEASCRRGPAHHRAGPRWAAAAAALLLVIGGIWALRGQSVTNSKVQPLANETQWTHVEEVAANLSPDWVSPTDVLLAMPMEGPATAPSDTLQ
jgi:hypothetical protein